MIPIYLEIPDKAKKIINKNVGYIFESLICTCEGLNLVIKKFYLIFIHLI